VTEKEVFRKIFQPKDDEVKGKGKSKVVPVL
jgi:hypothetical protein